MKVLVDAQLPYKLVGWLNAAGCDALHTLDLPNANRSTDLQVIELAAFQTHSFAELARGGIIIRS